MSGWPIAPRCPKRRTEWPETTAVVPGMSETCWKTAAASAGGPKIDGRIVQGADERRPDADQGSPAIRESRIVGDARRYAHGE